MYYTNIQKKIRATRGSECPLRLPPLNTFLNQINALQAINLLKLNSQYF
jgi:hypothetical protein